MVLRILITWFEILLINPNSSLFEQKQQCAAHVQSRDTGDFSRKFGRVARRPTLAAGRQQCFECRIMKMISQNVKQSQNLRS